MTSSSIWEYLRNTGFYYSLIHPFSSKPLDLTLFAIQTDILLPENRWGFVHVENYCFSEQSKAACLPLDDTVPSTLASSVAGTMNLFPICRFVNQKCLQEAVVISHTPFQIEQDNKHHQPKNQMEAISDLSFYFFRKA